MTAFPAPVQLLINRRVVEGVTSVGYNPGDPGPWIGPLFSVPLDRAPSILIEINVPSRLTQALPDMCRPVRAEVRVQNRRRGWIFPDDPFITYEPSDEGWCRTLGFGREGYLFDSWLIEHGAFEFVLAGSVREPRYELRITGTRRRP